MKTNELCCPEGMAAKVLGALQELRVPFSIYEANIHQQVAACLDQKGLIYIHEAPLAKGCRADFLVGNVVIEIKKGKPSSGELRRQLSRYAACEGVEALIVIAESNVTLPNQLCGKPIFRLCLRSLWGVALP